MSGSLGAGFFKAAQWMSRRNGVSVAKSVAQRLQELEKGSVSQSPPVEIRRRLLATRRGWQRLKGDRYQFKTGDQIELKTGTSMKELMVQIASIEVLPLGHGLPPEAQKQLIADASEAAIDWWRKNAAPRIISP